MKTVLSLLFVLVFALPVFAAPPEGGLDDPALELRAREISGNLRCPVCEGQSVADSHAPLAADLRALVRARLAAGDSDAETYDYIRARYGDAVLMKPPLAGRTWLLWLAPVLVFIAGCAAGALYLRRKEEA